MHDKMYDLLKIVDWSIPRRSWSKMKKKNKTNHVCSAKTERNANKPTECLLYIGIYISSAMRLFVCMFLIGKLNWNHLFHFLSVVYKNKTTSTKISYEKSFFLSFDSMEQIFPNHNLYNYIKWNVGLTIEIRKTISPHFYMVSMLMSHISAFRIFFTWPFDNFC